MQRLKNIDSLRTIAACLVFLYHVDFIEGGFVGVDIFFVISGFIISNLIINKKFNKYFLLNFFAKRINRLLPAIIVLCIISIIVGYFILLPEEMNFLAHTIKSSLIFNSNNFFYFNTNYFSEVSNSPILHTWTLGLEFQFYIFIIVFAIFFKSHTKYWLILAIFFSICLAQFGGNLKFERPFIEDNIKFFSPLYGSFFLFPTRLFEFLIGVFFLINFDKIKYLKKFRFLDYLSVFFIITSAVYFNKYTPHPSLYTLLLCISAAYLLITTGNNKSYIERILFFKPLYSFGLLTYGFYIWHYIIIFFYKTYFGANLLLEDQLLLLIYSLITTYISFYFLEKPMSSNKTTLIKKSFFYLFSVVLLISAIFFVEKTNGFSSRLDLKNLIKLKSFDDYEKNNSNCRGKILDNICKHGDQNNLNTVLWGDSHAHQLVPVIKKVANEKKFGFYEYSIMGCPPIKNIERLDKASQNCLKKTEIIYKKIVTNPKIKNVIIHAYWSYYFNKEHTYSLSNSSIDMEFRAQLIELVKNDKNIFIILSIPEMKTNPKKYFFRKKLFNNKSLENDTKFQLDLKTHNSNNYEFLKTIENIKNKNIYKFDPGSVLCNQSNCFSVLKEKILYRNESHISKKNSFILYEEMKKFLIIK
jgi:peptidoglycan/LPS O-acetylase OafA/YrhL